MKGMGDSERQIRKLEVGVEGEGGMGEKNVMGKHDMWDEELLLRWINGIMVDRK